MRKELVSNQEGSTTKVTHHYKDHRQDEKTSAMSTETAAALPRAYRRRFACENKVRYFRSSKRRVRWNFGLIDLDALRNGKKGSDACGEEHTVELSWSLKSGKTRIYWNDSNISNFFRSSLEQAGDKSEFTWKTNSDIALKVLVYSQVEMGLKQFDLIVDGVNFFELPNIAELGSTINVPQSPEIDEVASEESIEQVYVPMRRERPVPTTITHNNMDHSNNSRSSVRRADRWFDNSDFRSSRIKVDFRDDVAQVEDELHSDHYSATLETLRDQIVQCLPQLEEMISRAIIDSLFVTDPDMTDSTSFSSFSDEDTHDFNVEQMEVNALWDAYEWVSLNMAFAPRPNCEDVALKFMQKHVEDLFKAVCHDHVYADEAARILLGVAAVIGLKFVNSITADRIIFCNLPKDYTTEELQLALQPFGEFKTVAVVKDRSFGYAWFVDEDTAHKVQQACLEEELLIRGEDPKPLVVSESLPDVMRLRTFSSVDQASSNPALPTAFWLSKLPLAENPDKSVQHRKNSLSLDSRYQHFDCKKLPPSLHYIDHQTIGNLKHGQSLPTLIHQ